MEQAIKKNFIKENCMDLFKIFDNLDDLFNYIEAPVEIIHTVKDLKEG